MYCLIGLGCNLMSIGANSEHGGLSVVLVSVRVWSEIHCVPPNNPNELAEVSGYIGAFSLMIHREIKSSIFVKNLAQILAARGCRLERRRRAGCEGIQRMLEGVGRHGRTRIGAMGRSLLGLQGQGGSRC